jgi:RNA polymerase sigma-70 factor, ECF subfamily
MSHDPIVQDRGACAMMRRSRVHERPSVDLVPIKIPRPTSKAIDRASQKFVQSRVTEVGCRMVELLPRLRSFARSLTHDQTLCEDLVQETCVRALERLDQWRPDSRLDSWMYRIAQNLWIDHLRTQKARGEIVDMAAVGGISDCDGRLVAETRLTILELRKRIARLPLDQQVLIRLVCVDGLSYKEAAETLDAPTGTVMSRLARVRAALGDAKAGASRGRK